MGNSTNLLGGGIGTLIEVLWIVAQLTGAEIYNKEALDNLADALSTYA